jgi:hypothetical protein
MGEHGLVGEQVLPSLSVLNVTDVLVKTYRLNNQVYFAKTCGN